MKRSLYYEITDIAIKEITQSLSLSEIKAVKIIAMRGKVYTSEACAL